MSTKLSERRDEQFVNARPLSWRLIARLFAHFGSYKWVLFAGNFLCLLCAFGDMAIVREVRKLIDSPELRTAPLHLLLAPLLFYALLNRVAGWAQWLVTMRATNKAVEDLRLMFFEKLLTLSKGFYDKHKAGWLISRNTGDIFQISNFLNFSLMMLIYFGTAIAFAFREMSVVSPVLLLPTIIIIPAVFVVTRQFQKKMTVAQRKARAQNSKLVANLAESVKGVRVVHAFTRQEINMADFEEINQDNRAMEMRVARLNALFLPSIDFLGILNTTIVISFATLLMRGSIPMLPQVHLTPGQLVAYIAYMNIVVWPIRMLLELYNQSLAAMAAAERIYEIMDLDPEVTDEPGAVDIDIAKGQIDLDSVSFRYSADTPWVLKGVSISIPGGSTVALVGETGAGKTTLSSLIARFYDVTEGSIRIDGQDLRKCTQRSLHESMGIVLQEGYLFSGSVMDNLKFRRPDLSDAEVIEIAKTLQTHDSIMALSDGYDTQVMEGGGTISHGQRQIISLTRALVADPKILVLDEPTSSLDIQTERVLQTALEKLLQNRTTIVIAHRLSTVRNADTIMVVGDDGIIETGSHEDLMSRGGAYSALVSKADEKGTLE